MPVSLQTHDQKGKEIVRKGETRMRFTWCESKVPPSLIGQARVTARNARLLAKCLIMEGPVLPSSTKPYWIPQTELHL